MSFDKQDFSYAVALMSGQDHTFTVNGPNVRDGLFKDILSTFDGPINVFQVGAIESLDGKFRVGSGWSDIIFGEYIQWTIISIYISHSSICKSPRNSWSYFVNSDYFGNSYNSLWCTDLYCIHAPNKFNFSS